MHSLAATLLSLCLLAPFGPGWLGVYLEGADEAVIREVIPNTPAQKAGLKAGDVLLAVNGKETKTSQAFIDAIQGSSPGDRVRIKLRREKRVQTVVVRLGERPEDPEAGVAAEAAEPAPPRPPMAVDVPPVASEAPVRAVRIAGKPYLGISVRESDRGVAIDRVIEGGPCSKSGIEAGDVLVSIGDHRVRNLDQLDAALGKFRPGQSVPVGLRSNDAVKSTVVKIGVRPGSGGGAMAVEVPAPEVVLAKPVQVEEVVVEAVEAKPERIIRRNPRRAPRPARPDQAGPSAPARPARPARRPGADQGSDLQREITALRKELAELRKLLEELKRSQGRGRE